MLPIAYPDLSPDDALSEVISMRVDGDGGDLQTRIVHAAGRQALVPRRLGGFIRTINRRDDA
jgi:hypothetical protein